MTHEDVNRWLGRYVAAWESGDGAQIGDLFAEDARYRYWPGSQPLEGREAIVKSWLEHDDAPGSFEASYACWALEGERAVAVGTTTYTTEEKVYDNAFLLVFDADGRCADFAELYLRHPAS